MKEEKINIQDDRVGKHFEHARYGTTYLCEKAVMYNGYKFLTLIQLKNSKDLSSAKIVENKILGPSNTLGIRFSKHPFCISLANYCSVPITTTSVNRTGEEPKTNVDEILNSFKNEIDLIIEDGTLMNSASKIYKYEAGNLRNIR